MMGAKPFARHTAPSGFTCMYGHVQAALRFCPLHSSWLFSVSWRSNRHSTTASHEHGPTQHRRTTGKCTAHVCARNTHKRRTTPNPNRQNEITKTVKWSLTCAVTSSRSFAVSTAGRAACDFFAFFSDFFFFFCVCKNQLNRIIKTE